MMRYCLVLLTALLLGSAAMAKDATPMAEDPVLEARVLNVSKELRCMVCQNQTLADSHAELAMDLKNEVREMLASGKTDQEVIDFMVQRYGDFVRYRPPVKTSTLMLWFGPFMLVLLGAGVLVYQVLRRRRQVTDAPLSDEENKRLENILK